MGVDKYFEGPITKSTNSVFDSINKGAEALDILNKYKNANESIVRSYVENVQILGMSEPVKLVDIYSTTMISTSIHRRLFSTEWANLGSKEQLNRNGKNKTIVRADEFLNSHDRVVILAGPGSGKTTLLKYTALTYIDSDLFEKSALDKKLIPFFISLPELAISDFTIEKFLSEKIKISTHEYADEYVKRVLIKGKAIVLLDSLDEVPLSVRDRVYRLIKEFSIQYKNVKIVITCRVADYNVTLEGFYEAEISRLTERSINKIIKAWFKGKPQKAKKLLNHLAVDKDVYSLTETPLLLSLLCIQYSNDLNIPNRKTELYSRCIDALLKLWDTSRGFRRDTAFSAFTDDRKQKLFSDVAYHFMCEKDCKYVFSDKDLISFISDFIERFGLHGELSSGIIKEIESHHGILEKYTAESYTFSHVSFQEYFVAVALVAKHIEVQYVKENLSNSRSASVIIFMVALMDDPSPVLKILMERSVLKGIKTYPAMCSRIEVLSLLYRCMNSGVSILPTLRNEIYLHIVKSQMEISNIYQEAKTFPIANLEDDGISHTFFYLEKTRPTLGAALISYRKLSNEILLSPNENYADVALSEIGGIPNNTSKIVDLCIKSCLLVPLSGANPKKVLLKLEQLREHLDNDSLLQRIVLRTIEKLKVNYIEE